MSGVTGTPNWLRGGFRGWIYLCAGGEVGAMGVSSNKESSASWRVINVSHLFSVVTKANETYDWIVLAGEDGDVAGLGGGGSGGLRGAGFWAAVVPRVACLCRVG